MAIINITMSPEQNSCNIIANDDGSFDGGGVENYIVSFNTADDPRSRPYIARSTTETVGGIRIPALWESHPYDPWIYVKNKTVRMWEGPLHWLVTVEYEYVENPLEEPFIAEWLFSSSNEPIDRDREGNALVNSSDEPWDPPIQEEAHDIVLRITRNEPSYNPLAAYEYKKSVNQDTFLWFPEKTVKCSVFEGLRQRRANLYYAQVHYEFMIRLDKTPDGGSYIGWLRRILDQGLRTKSGGNYTLIKDSEGNPITTPVLLNGSGQQLASGANPVFLTYETKNLKNFSTLGFSTLDAPFYYGMVS